MIDPRDLERDLRAIEDELARLEIEYTKFFTNRRARPPNDLRFRLEGRIRRWSSVHIPASADRFRFSTLQARLYTYIRLWDQALRAREEGRPGPFSYQESPDPARGRAGAGKAGGKSAEPGADAPAQASHESASRATPGKPSSE